MSPPIERVIKYVAARIYLFKSLLDFLVPDVDEREIITETFSKILELEKGANYVVPFERYMKTYMLNSYYSKK